MMWPERRTWTPALFAFILISTMSPCFSQTSKTPSLAPVNPAFVQYLQESSSGRLQTFAQGRFPLGLIPSPVDLSQIKPAPPEDRAILSLPALYDLRTTGKLTSIKDQADCGSCWAFAAYGSLESCLLPGETRDFSENNLKNLIGFDIDCCVGGNACMTIAYLSRWGGPVNETSDPYNRGNCTSPSATLQKHVQDVLFLPDRTGYTDNDTIKQAVMTYGAVYTTMTWDESSYNGVTHSYYYGSPGYGSSHAVCIVGWDDNYDKSKFSIQPPANGAFIIRNSWGTDWGQGGYFYISYYDLQVALGNVVFNGTYGLTNYDRVYQYDPLGWMSSMGFGNTSAWAANVFTAVGSERISAVSFYAASPNTSYDIYIYLDPSSGPINPSGWAARTTGTTDAGYHTISIGSVVMADAGQGFSVVVKLTTPSYNYPIAIEYPFPDYSDATANPGESYVSNDGSSWSDITSSCPNTNVCIKAFSTTTPKLVVTPESAFQASGPAGGPMNPSSFICVLNNPFTGSIEWTAASTQPWVTLSAESGTISGYASAQVTVSINSAANNLPIGEYADTITFTNTTNGIGTTSRGVALSIRDAWMAVSPADTFDPTGVAGGPFAPSSKVYTITNIGYTDLYWNASKTQPWTTLSPTGGVVHPLEQAQVTVSINSGADGLPVGTYSDPVVFTNTTNGDGNTSRAVNLSVLRNYVVIPAPYSWTTLDSCALLYLDDDGVSSARTLPFTFTFYGQPYTQIYVGANGLIGFGSSADLSERSNSDIPSLLTPNSALYPYWDDLNPGAGGSVRVAVDGTAPNRQYVIGWMAVPHHSAPTLPFAFQAILYEGSNDIILRYQEVQAADISYGAGRSATIGVEDMSGRVACKYSFNGSSPLANSQAFLLTMNPTSCISDAKRRANRFFVTLSGMVVTGVFSSTFYIEAEDRSSGILVYKPNHGMTPGMRVDVFGTASTSVSGEKFISATSVTQTGTGTIAPIMLANQAIGGSDWEYDPNTYAGQKGIKGAYDLNNIGLLVCTAGKVTYVGADYFYVDDGSGAKDNTSHKGVKVSATGLTLPGLNEFVKVCGVSSCSKSGSDLYRLIRATSITVED